MGTVAPAGGGRRGSPGRGAARRCRTGLPQQAGFALQLCVLRHPGRLLAPGEFVSPAVVDFIGRQLDLDGDDLADLPNLRRLSASGPSRAARRVNSSSGSEKKRNRRSRTRTWSAGSVEACRDTRTILPATTTIERLCAAALVDAERRIEARIAERVPPRAKAHR